MDFQPTEEQQAIAEALHDFALNEIRPAARECEEAGKASERIEKQLIEMGVAAPVAEEFGGQGTFDATTSVLIAEEVAWGDPGVAFGVLGAGLVATLIDLAGTAEQRSQILPTMLNGAKGSLALAERDAGADITLLDTTAEPVGASGDSVKITGTKYGVVDADSAGIRLVVAGGGDELGLFLLPTDASIDAKLEDKLGLRSARTFKVTIDAQVPADSRIGGPGADRKKLTNALLRAKLLNAGIAVGLARAAVEYATTYAQERTAFGRPIGAFQGIAFKIADRAMDLDTARLAVWEAAWAIDQGRDNAGRLVMAACGHAAAAAVACADDGVQILGGHGYMRDHPEEMWYRDAMTLATFDSPSMIGDLYLAQTWKAGAK
jgi:alkylation response protein AidB-like acyl-CoA dehydrogenase